VRVEIVDINDNAPTFRPDFVALEISESAQPGTEFALPAADDADGPNFRVAHYDLRQALLVGTTWRIRWIDPVASAVVAAELEPDSDADPTIPFGVRLKPRVRIHTGAKPCRTYVDTVQTVLYGPYLQLRTHLLKSHNEGTWFNLLQARTAPLRPSAGATRRHHLANTMDRAGRQRRRRGLIRTGLGRRSDCPIRT